MPVIQRTVSLATTLSRDDTVSSNSLVRDPAKEFSWEWEDKRMGLWHSLPEFISCFLEPASKTQSHGGVRTSKLTWVFLSDDRTKVVYYCSFVNTFVDKNLWDTTKGASDTWSARGSPCLPELWTRYSDIMITNLVIQRYRQIVCLVFERKRRGGSANPLLWFAVDTSLTQCLWNMKYPALIIYLSSWSR